MASQLFGVRLADPLIWAIALPRLALAAAPAVTRINERTRDRPGKTEPPELPPEG